jgi:hypothetical protein
MADMLRGIVTGHGRPNSGGGLREVRHRSGLATVFDNNVYLESSTPYVFDKLHYKNFPNKMVFCILTSNCSIGSADLLDK